MEQTVFLFCSRKQFASWRIENCGNCRKESAAGPVCDLSAALKEALYHEDAVPLDVAERLGYFDMDDEDRPVAPGSWTCREFEGKDFPSTQTYFMGGPGRPGELPDPSPRTAAD